MISSLMSVKSIKNRYLEKEDVLEKIVFSEYRHFKNSDEVYTL